jgi:hypothetical protein
VTEERDTNRFVLINENDLFLRQFLNPKITRLTQIKLVSDSKVQIRNQSLFIFLASVTYTRDQTRATRSNQKSKLENVAEDSKEAGAANPSLSVSGFATGALSLFLRHDKSGSRQASSRERTKATDACS